MKKKKNLGNENRGSFSVMEWQDYPELFLGMKRQLEKHETGLHQIG